MFGCKLLQNEMRICLSFCDTERELFLSERGQFVFIIANFLKMAGNLVTIRPVGEVGWWSSTAAQRLASEFVLSDKDNSDFDCVIDIGGSVHPSIRRKIAQTVIVFLYNNALFDELQDTPYLTKDVKRHIERGTVDQVWIWSGQEEHCLLLSSLYHCPVRCVPFIWSPVVINELCSSIDFSCPVLLQDNSFTIFQSNKDNTMCSIWPLSFINERLDSVEDISSCVVFDEGDILKNSKFYKDNIESNLSFEKILQYKKFTSIEELYNMCSKSITIFHTRYKPYQIDIVNFMWMGLPLIHNSPVLRKGLSFWNSYRDNSFDGAEKSIEVVKRVFTSENVAKRQREIMKEMLETSYSFDKGKDGWLSVLGEIPRYVDKSQEIIVSFSDMWEGFDASDNFFIDLLRSRVGKAVIGVDGIVKDSSLHICGPFGGRWQLVPSQVPIVLFSGERWKREEHYEKSTISLFLTHDTEEDERHIRLPLWILFLELWGGSPKLGRNPNGLPLCDAIKNSEDWKDRKRFCGFVVSNPTNMERNIAFELLNAYEEIDSGGAYKNNIGGPISHMYGGGGGGDVAKHAFLRERKFCLCYENGSAPGYVTEKLLHAKMAGCIPIYWGCKEAGLVDFDPRGFIDMTGVSVNDIVSKVDEVASADSASYMASIPALGPKELDRMWACVDKVGDALMSLIHKYKARNIDSSIEMAESKVMVKNEVAEGTQKYPVPLFVSFTTKKFIPSIEHSLEGVKGLHISGVEYLLYTGEDIEEDDLSGIKNKYGNMLTVRKIPCEESPVTDFPDFWNPRHFGWKLWIYKTVSHEFKDRLIIYSDAGAQWVKTYPEMFEKAWNTGICFVVDKNENKNRFWCSEEMISEMKVTEEELEVPQILGGIMAIRGGHEGAMAYFDKCLNYAYNPRNLRGRKLIRVLPGGQPVGHRHDQSIMSVERARSGMSFGYVLEHKATCMESLRRTLQNDIPIYLHRGNYVANSRSLNYVDDIWIINLERRFDRLVAFNDAYPTLGEVAHRFAAIDGKMLQLTPAIAHLFYHNDFKWKKSVLGCALSHILLWAQLACEGPSVNSYLILEDDVRFTDRERIDQVLQDLPEDAELAYLGGVLPRNRNIYNQAIKSVNDNWAEIIPNKFFSKIPLPVFHHCAYGYYLTKQGARKLIASLTKGDLGCFTSIDHYLGHPTIGISKYVLNIPIAVCFQEADPKYESAAFDDFGRIDSYDSDIWNNTETYKMSTPKDFEYMKTPLGIPSLYPLICDVLRQIPSNRETCTLLSPGPYIYMLQEEKKTDEIDFVKQFLAQLQAEVKMPAIIHFGRRIDSLVHKKDEIKDGVCSAISAVESSGENFTKSCLMSKMFLISGSETNEEIIKCIVSTGSVPIYVRRSGDEKRWEELRSCLGLVELSNWVMANKFISILLADEEKGEKYRWGIAEKCLQLTASAQVESQFASA